MDRFRSTQVVMPPAAYYICLNKRADKVEIGKFVMLIKNLYSSAVRSILLVPIKRILIKASNPKLPFSIVSMGIKTINFHAAY